MWMYTLPNDFDNKFSNLNMLRKLHHHGTILFENFHFACYAFKCSTLQLIYGTHLVSHEYTRHVDVSNWVIPC